MYHDLTEGKISRSLLLFALPMMAGNLLQQFYNIADTLIVGRVLGSNALAAVGSAYTLMTFLTSIFLGLSMGSGALFSIYKGKNDQDSLRNAIVHAFALIMAVTVLLNVLVYIGIDPILHFLRVPDEVWDGMKAYLLVIFAGIIATSLYNYFSCLLRALGNSTIPLVFLAVSAVLNIGLDLLFVAVLPWGIRGAALATVIAQYVSGIGITLYVLLKCRDLLPSREDLQFNRQILGEIGNLSSMTCVQQSVMNFGILMVQGLVNSFGPVVMAAFAAAVKIDTFAYLPVQDFGNAYSTFIAQNYGAGKKDRIRKGTRESFLISFLFCIVISAVVCIFAAPLMRIFVSAKETAVIASGVRYLRIEGAFYCGIGCLFLLYGYYRAVKKPGMSVILTVISLGTRVALAYILSAYIGETGIWMAIPIGWVLADVTGLVYMKFHEK
ncbi:MULTISPECIES: MATE family efflux transporter [Lachnospiraceae]|jgi:putative MATE family efflux protein|uniref:MATE family efflux transporter n=1 Tax=Lachnospiraceae TaxID=186803 RepID=UPI00033863C4|nr:MULTISPECIES: MATE family efflux transporter [Blautia]NSG21428.1 MATE family efflux transporter [Blautia obeum]CDB78769.1 putative efflux protein MATE family [Blautia sp. CAG:237]